MSFKEDKDKIKMTYEADMTTNEVLEATAKKDIRSKSSIVSIVMREWASGKFPESSIRPATQQATRNE